MEVKSNKIMHSSEFFFLSGSFADVGFFRHFNLVLFGGGEVARGWFLKMVDKFNPPSPHNQN